MTEAVAGIVEGDAWWAVDVPSDAEDPSFGSALDLFSYFGRAAPGEWMAAGRAVQIVEWLGAGLFFDIHGAMSVEGLDDPEGDMIERIREVVGKDTVISTSMEASALFVVGSIRKVRVGEVLAVIGLTYKDEPIVKKVGVEEAIRCAIPSVPAARRPARTGRPGR